LPGALGGIVAAPQDAVIHGPGIVREQDGSLSGWKDPETLLAWPLELPQTGAKITGEDEKDNSDQVGKTTERT